MDKAVVWNGGSKPSGTGSHAHRRKAVSAKKSSQIGAKSATITSQDGRAIQTNKQLSLQLPFPLLFSCVLCVHIMGEIRYSGKGLIT